MSFAFLSVFGFFIRGIWMISFPAMLDRRMVKIAPHVIDSLLLISAIALAIQLQSTPFSQPWLAAKILGLLFYIALGMIAFRFGKTLTIKILTWIGALFCASYIIAVAFSKTPLIFYR